MAAAGEIAEALAAVAGARLVECELLSGGGAGVVSAQLVFVKDDEPDERLELFVALPILATVTLTRTRKTDSEGRWRTRRAERAAADEALDIVTGLPPLADLGPGPGRDG